MKMDVKHYIKTRVDAIALWFRLQPWDRIPSTSSTLFSIYLVEIETLLDTGLRKGPTKMKMRLD